MPDATRVFWIGLLRSRKPKVSRKPQVTVSRQWVTVSIAPPVKMGYRLSPLGFPSTVVHATYARMFELRTAFMMVFKVIKVTNVIKFIRDINAIDLRSCCFPRARDAA
jgi:hypothetical protein